VVEKMTKVSSTERRRKRMFFAMVKVVVVGNAAGEPALKVR
jgi:hypothetical protein